MGANGAGKTTFLRTLVGLVSPQAGEIIVSGENIRQKGTVEICKTIAYLPQDPSALLFADRVLDELLITLRNHRQTEAKNRQKEEHQDADRLLAMQLLEKLGLIDQAQAYPRDLSVGQRQRVALGAIMVHEPKALLLDEPTRGLDWGAKQRLVELLRAWRSEGVGIMLVTHDVELVAACADRVAIMAAGRIQADGAPEMLLAQAPFLAQMAELFPGAGCLTVESVLQRQLL
jgi:energy-coupling factor transport system ATP-binding protein